MRAKSALLGSLAQAGLFAGLFVLVKPPFAAYVPTLLVGGVVGGWTSDRYEREFLDGGGAALLGIVLSVLVIGWAAWAFGSTSLLGYRIELTGPTLMYGFLWVITFGLLAGVVGAIIGQVSGTLSRRR